MALADTCGDQRFRKQEKIGGLQSLAGQRTCVACIACVARISCQPHQPQRRLALSMEISVLQQRTKTVWIRGKGLRGNLFSICFELHCDLWIRKRDTIP
jgi:hypothetical protein